MVYVRFARDVPRQDALRIATDAARAADPANAKLTPRVNPLAGLVLDAYYQRAVPFLAGAVILVFLVLCANVSSLQLAHLTARQREFSVQFCAWRVTRTRDAPGIHRERRARCARRDRGNRCRLGARGSLARILPEAFLLRSLNPLNIDVRALAVALGFGNSCDNGCRGPAGMDRHPPERRTLAPSDRAGRNPDTQRACRHTRPLIGEIALACTLLVGATLLVRSFINLAQAERGLDAGGVLTAWMSLPRSAFPDPASRGAAARSLEERIAVFPVSNRWLGPMVRHPTAARSRLAIGRRMRRAHPS